MAEVDVGKAFDELEHELSSLIFQVIATRDDDLMHQTLKVAKAALRVKEVLHTIAYMSQQ